MISSEAINEIRNIIREDQKNINKYYKERKKHFCCAPYNMRHRQKCYKGN